MQHVSACAFLNGLKLNFAPGFTKVCQICLCVGLILADQSLREGNVFDFSLHHGFFKCECGFAVGFAQCVHHSERDIVEGLSETRTAVVDSGDFFIEAEEVHFHHIVHVHEIAHLSTVRVAEAALKEFYLAFGAVLEELMVCDGSHTAFVLFVRTVDIEVSESCDWGSQTVLHFTTKYLIKEIFRVAVNIQRFFVADVFFEDAGGAVRCRRGRVNKRDSFALAPAE